MSSTSFDRKHERIYFVFIFGLCDKPMYVFSLFCIFQSPPLLPLAFHALASILRCLSNQLRISVCLPMLCASLQINETLLLSGFHFGHFPLHTSQSGTKANSANMSRYARCTASSVEGGVLYCNTDNQLTRLLIRRNDTHVPNCKITSVIVLWINKGKFICFMDMDTDMISGYRGCMDTCTDIWTICCIDTLHYLDL